MLAFSPWVRRVIYVYKICLNVYKNLLRMDKRYLQMLPSELQSIVAAIEAKAGCTIEVVPDEKAAAFDNLELRFMASGECGATITFKGTEIGRCALIHEVLHIHRNWGEEVPYLKPLGPQYMYQASWLNDLLEHLVIIPEEQKYEEAESRKHWSGLCDELLWDVRGRWYGMPKTVLKQCLFQLRAMRDIALPFWETPG